MTKPLVGVDLDGVLYDFETAHRAVLRNAGHEVASVRSTSWNHVKNEVGDDAWRWMWSDPKARREIFRGGPAYLDAVDGVRQLEQVADVAIITHRPLDVADITLRWLGDHKLHPRQVHHCSGDKSLIDSSCIGYVDDRTDNARELARSGARVWVPARSYNGGLTEGATGIFYFTRWEEVVEWVKLWRSVGR